MPSQPIHKLVIALLIILWLLTLTSLVGRYVYLELATHFRLPPNVFDMFVVADPEKQAIRTELAAARAELQDLRRLVSDLKTAARPGGP